VFYTRIKEKSKLNALREGAGRVVEVMEDHASEEMMAQEHEGNESVGSEELAW